MGANADLTSPTFAGGVINYAGVSPPQATLDQNRLAIQAAIDFVVANGGGTVYCPPGMSIPFSKKPATTYGINVQNAAPIRFLGNGSTWRMAGDAGGVAADFYGFYLRGAGGHVFEGVRFSQRDVTNFGEQTHMVQVGDAGTSQIEDVDFYGCQFMEGRGGDGIRLLAGALEVRRINVVGCRFDDCDRSGISVQRGTRKVNVQSCIFRNTGDQDIDFESTADGFIGEFTVIGNTMERAPGNAVAVAVSLGGYGGVYSSERNIFAYNRIVGGGINSGNINRAWIVGNELYLDQGGAADPVIKLYRRVNDVWIQGNRIYRGPNAFGTAAAVQVTQNNGFNPIGVKILDNVIEQGGVGNVIDLDSVQEFDVRGNRIRWRSAAPADTYCGVWARSVTAAISGIVANNRIEADVQSDDVTAATRLLTAVFLSPSGVGQIGDVSVIGNVVKNALSVVDLSATQAQLVSGLPVISGNTPISVTTEVANYLGAYAIAGNPGGVCDLVGHGSPAGAVPAAAGSRYLRRDLASPWTVELWLKNAGASTNGQISSSTSGWAKVA